MALTILNNIAALAAENQLNITSNNLNSTLEQLSSGSKINSGADDPAGLAIANGLSANIAALTQSSSNATDGVGELQVADGALSQVTTLLNRAVTLATESATGTVSNSQRTALDAEYQSIKAEIDDIGSTTNYNGGQVFTNNTLNVFLSDGSTSGSSQIGVSTGTLSANGLDLGGAVAATGTLTQTAGTPAVSATDTMTAAAFTLSTAASNTLTVTVAAPATGDTVTVGGTTYTFGPVSSGQNYVAVGGSEQQSLANMAAAINATSGGSGSAYGAGTIANANVTATSTATTLVVTEKQNGSAAGANIAAADTVAGGGTYTWGGLVAGTNGDTVTVGNQAYTFVTHLSTTPTANEVIGGSEATDIANLVAAINGAGGGQYSASTPVNTQVSAAAGDSAGNNTGTKAFFTAITAGTAGNFITASSSNGGVTFTNGGTFGGTGNTSGAAAGTAPVAAAGNTVTVGSQQYTFVNSIGTPTANEVEVLLGSSDAASLTNLANAVNGGSGAGVDYAYGSSATANTSATAATGTTAAGLDTITFTASTKGTAGNAIVTAQTGTANTFGSGYLAGGTAGSVNDLLTQSDAQAALTLINDAVAAVAALRGNIGSTVNRLQSASNVINNQTQNLTAAENDVTAADIPSAVANLSQYSILEQTGISALAQANQQQQLVLKLLQ